VPTNASPAATPGWERQGEHAATEPHQEERQQPGEEPDAHEDDDPVHGQLWQRHQPGFLHALEDLAG